MNGNGKVVVNLATGLEDLFALDPLGEAKDAKAIEVTNPSP